MGIPCSTSLLFLYCKRSVSECISYGNFMGICRIPHFLLWAFLSTYERGNRQLLQDTKKTLPNPYCRRTSPLLLLTVYFPYYQVFTMHSCAPQFTFLYPDRSTTYSSGLVLNPQSARWTGCCWTTPMIG